MNNPNFCKESNGKGLFLLANLEFLNKKKENKEIFVKTFKDTAKYAKKLSEKTIIKLLKEN